MPKTKRVLEILDCVAIACMGGANAAANVMNGRNPAKAMQAALDDVYVDVSQNPQRRAYSRSNGILKCLHTATCLYSFKRDGVILPIELMFLQGHGLDIKIPPSMRQKQLHDLAGNGICLPCLGSILLATLVSVEV